MITVDPKILVESVIIVLLACLYGLFYVFYLWYVTTKETGEAIVREATYPEGLAEWEEVPPEGVRNVN